MEIIFILVSILQSVAIGLGVGTSTLAITSFFVAINDGQIDPSERKMLGVIYIVLRVAMVLILLSTLILGLFTYGEMGVKYFTTFILAEWILITVLYVNAVLMTKHIMPSKFGPAIQATSWYTLGILSALVPLGLIDFTYLRFFITYFLAVVTVTIVVNVIMSFKKYHLK